MQLWQSMFLEHKSSGMPVGFSKQRKHNIVQIMETYIAKLLIALEKKSHSWGGGGGGKL